MQERDPADVTMGIDAAREIELSIQRLTARIISLPRIIDGFERGINET
jgi:hypothetical protein